MHEMSIAQNIVDIILDEMAKHEATILKSIRLNIGEMTAVVPDSLSFCFKLITEGSAIEGADLIIDMIPLKGYCHGCRSEFKIKDYAFACPLCGGSKIDTMGGRDLSIVEIEVE